MILHVHDEGVSRKLIERRKRLGQDHKDEVWDGVYVIMPDPTQNHQRIVKHFVVILSTVVDMEGRGEALPGTNVSDRRDDWKENFRGPDVVVVMAESHAEERAAHWYGGPDILIEVQSPGDRSEQKLPFYSRIGVREAWLIDRDTRAIQLFRLEGDELLPVEEAVIGGKRWFVSEVVPLQFRSTRGKSPTTEIRRTDGKPGRWTF